MRTPDGCAQRPLASYTDPEGTPHELLAWKGAAGSVLVVDHAAPLSRSPLLIAHLAADEPPENAMIVCEDYLVRARAGVIRCRSVSDEDLVAAPAVEDYMQVEDYVAEKRALAPASVPAEPAAGAFALSLQRPRGAIPQLRWWRVAGHVRGVRDREGSPSDQPVSLREAVGALQSYEPLRSITHGAIAWAQDHGGMSTTMLRAELARVQLSPIVLNRGLREAVLATVENGALSMSEIAIRCGRVKRDARGNESGETSWLARRLGLLPEGGQLAPTPWVHSKVLALIARSGLGIAPREVEL